MEILIPFQTSPIQSILNEAEEPSYLLILAHGAGAPMHHSFLEHLTNEFKQEKVSVLRFNFPYISQGKKFPGNPKPNIAAWKVVVNWALNEYRVPIFISGKSYGGRMASHLVAENPQLPIQGLIYFGFPLHAPGNKSTERAAHLKSIDKPQLFLQGTNDALADISLMRTVISSSRTCRLTEFEGLDHSFKGKGQKMADIIKAIVAITTVWMKEKTQKN